MECSQNSVIGWVAKIYYGELLRALEPSKRAYVKPLLPDAFAVVDARSRFKEG
jgi:hypothetical protein